MASSFNDSVDQIGGHSIAAPTQPFDDGDVAFESPISDYPSSAPIYVSGGGLSPDQPESSSFYSTGETGTPFEDEFSASEGPVLPSLSEMQPEEGFALREWRRQNASRLEEKEKIEKELLNQIIDEADDYKITYHSKRKVTCESNKATNREGEKVYLSGREKFHEEADKSYWKAISELIPKEVVIIEKRGSKEQDKKTSMAAMQGPKPGKPTDLSRMRQILINLKHKTPLHLQHSPSSSETIAATLAGVLSSVEAVAVA